MRDVQGGWFDGQAHRLIAVEMHVYWNKISNAIEMLVRDVPEEEALRERSARLRLEIVRIEEAIATLNSLDTPEA